MYSCDLTVRGEVGGRAAMHPLGHYVLLIRVWLMAGPMIGRPNGLGDVHHDEGPSRQTGSGTRGAATYKSEMSSEYA